MSTTRRQVEFGYYPRQLAIEAGRIKIDALSDLKSVVDGLSASDGIDGGWVYAPYQEVRVLGRGTVSKPYPSRVFGLPKTHVVTHEAAESDDHIAFLVWVLSFLTGTRLTTTEAGFVDATPLEPGQLVDFGLHGGSLGKGMEYAETFWINNRSSPERSKLFGAAVHTLFLSHNPLNFQFESLPSFTSRWRLASP